MLTISSVFNSFFHVTYSILLKNCLNVDEIFVVHWIYKLHMKHIFELNVWNTT